jgi:XTP/dITP diphosphohydrolase
MKQEYVLASGNAGKLREISDLLEPLGFTIHPQSDWQVPEAEEIAATFVENSLIKARQAALYTGLPSIADDSGLVVPALDGRPGIFSARYAGDVADAQSNMDKLLAELSGKTDVDRNAYFYCALVLVKSVDDPAPLIATGRWYGQILEMPRGDGGFGYDPLFGIYSLSNRDRLCSAAELAPADKSRVSHRGQALKELVRQLHERDRGSTG